jgi:hypothetical protein
MSWRHLYRPEDTQAQRRALRHNHTARHVRKLFPPDTPIRVKVSGWRGTVKRHVPQLNSQGGYLVVQWVDGNTSRMSPINVEPSEPHLHFGEAS